jgi:hypothetical protein
MTVNRYANISSTALRVLAVNRTATRVGNIRCLGGAGGNDAHLNGAVAQRYCPRLSYSRLAIRPHPVDRP